jgi:hypothetical protein
MPSIQKRKIQKRSRQQTRRRLQSDDKLKLEAKKQHLEEERQKLEEERQKLEKEGQRLDERLEAYNKEEPVRDDNLGYNQFDIVGGCGGFKKHGNNHSKLKNHSLLNVGTLTNNDEINNEGSAIDLAQDGGCGLKKNMRPIPRSTLEKEEMRKIINQGLASGEFKLIQDNPTGNPMIVNALNGGSKPTQHRSVSLRTAVKLLKNYYTKHN